MSADENPIIVTIGVCRQCNSVHTTRVYHRDYPEVWAESRVDPHATRPTTGSGRSRRPCLLSRSRSGARPGQATGPHRDPRRDPAIRERCAAAAQELDARIARTTERSDQQDTDILHTHRLLLADPVLAEKVKSAIRDRRLDAEAASRHVLEGYESQFAQIRDDYLKQRVADLRCVVGLVLRHLGGHQQLAPPFGPDEPVILVTHEVLPSHLLLSQHLRLAGVLTEVGAETGHAAILARSLGIPVLAGLPGILGEVRTGDVVALDGHEGHAHINPDFEVEAAYQRLQRDEADRRDRLAGNRDREPVTVDGIRVELLANVNGPDDTALASRVGAGGVGLYRTEYLFLTHPRMPDEEEQLAAYRAVVEAAPGRTVTIRALDLGADKSVSYLGRRDEPNPALGFRGTRLLSASPELRRPSCVPSCGLAATAG